MKYFCIVLAHSVLWLSSLVAATPVDIAGAVSLKERDTEVGVLYDSQDDLWNDTSYKIHTASIEFGAKSKSVKNLADLSSKLKSICDEAEKAGKDLKNVVDTGKTAGEISNSINDINTAIVNFTNSAPNVNFSDLLGLGLSVSEVIKLLLGILADSDSGFAALAIRLITPAISSFDNVLLTTTSANSEVGTILTGLLQGLHIVAGLLPPI